MKKGDLFLLLTCVGLVLCVNYLILSLPLSVTSKGTLQILCNFAYSSAVLLGIRALPDTSNITRTPGGSNRLSHLAEAERIIRRRGMTTKTSSLESRLEASLKRRVNNATKT